MLRRSEQYDDATKLATELLATSARATALEVLGKIAHKQARLEDAREDFVQARLLHLGSGRAGDAALVAQALAALFMSQHRFADALRALDACITETQIAHDAITLGYCHMTAGVVLGRVGLFELAADELATARRSLTQSRDLAELESAIGALEQREGFAPADRAHHAQAVVAFERAIAFATIATRTRLRRRSELDLAFSLAELKRTDEAEQHLNIARELDAKNEDEDDRDQVAARIAFRRGDLPTARAINTRVYERRSAPERADDFMLRLCIMQAQIGVASGDLDATLTWAKRGVSIAEDVRREQSAFELRPWLLTIRRQPYEILFAALAAAHRVDDALVVFDSWQGRTLLDVMAREGASPPDNLRAAAHRTEVLQQSFPALSNAPVRKPPDREVMLAALRDVDLVALLVASDEVWRIDSQHGKREITNLGTLATWQPALDQVAGHPTEAALAESIGLRLLGSTAFRAAAEPIYVLLDGPLAMLPVAALRAHGQPIIASRPVIRAVRLSELACISAREAAPRATVLADSKGDLPHARREARATAARFGGTIRLGAEATREALLSSGGTGVLHLAVHGEIGMGGGALRMSDHAVSALEIADHRGWPSLVVLSACASGAADDGELATSLAAAFLESGTPQVIATLRPVSDRGAGELTSAFYRANGAVDPARALAQAQTELSTTGNTDWPNFVMFGHDICRKDLE